jgi:hypothetical protein
VALCQLPPSTWLNASTGTIYRHAADGPHTEHDGELGTGFSVDVARAWEAELEAAITPGKTLPGRSMWRRRTWWATAN